MIKKVYPLLFLLLLSLFLLPVKSEFWLSGWDNRSIVSLSFNVDSGTQFCFNVTFSDLNEACQDDFDDLRFYTFGGSIMNAWNETTVSESYVTVWLKSVGEQEFYVFYGNLGASNYWDEYAVFTDVIDNLILAMPMDENTGSTVYDLSGNSHTGTLGGSYAWVDGYYGSAINFTADTAFITLSGFDTLSELAMFYRLKPIASQPSAGAFYDLSWIYNASLGQVYNSGIQHFTFWFSNSSNYQYNLSTDTCIYDGDTWFSVACDWHPTGDLTVYLNGLVNNTLDASQYGIFELISPTFRLGRTSSNIIGVIDDVYWFDSLNSTQVYNLTNYYPDVQLIEGLVCCRVWLDPMPTVVFDEEDTSLTAEEALAVTIAVSLVFMTIPLVLVFSRKKQNDKAF